MQKKLLRNEIKTKSEALSTEYKKASSAQICSRVLSSASFRNAESIFVYVSTDNEPDTREIIEKALSRGKAVYVPKCIKKGVMLPVRITRGTKFISGYMGIKEPEKYDEEIEIKEIDLSVIPCISASLSGERLGHGAGFYDIFLKKVKTEKMCLCFHKLISDIIPTDENDIPMDCIITERGTFRSS